MLGHGPQQEKCTEKRDARADELFLFLTYFLSNVSVAVAVMVA